MTDPSPETLAAWDLTHVWHPFIQQDEWEADAPPLIIDRSDCVHLVDVHGRRYLDGICRLWTNLHGL
jgi:Adenosylmethionine-8-amino-7-oxononanoate aminotransferase